jgi:starch synthase (maltosyl-transferring)
MATRRRVLIENVTPIIDDGEYTTKRVVNDIFQIETDLISDGHDILNGCIKFRRKGKQNWQEIPLAHLTNDRWYARVELPELGIYEYTVEAWVDYLLTWQYNIRKKVNDKQNVNVELQDSIKSLNNLRSSTQKKDKELLDDILNDIVDNSRYEQAIEKVCSEEFEMLLRKYPTKDFTSQYERILSVRAENSRAEFSSWYEFFPRSSAKNKNRKGTLKDASLLLPLIAEMGFDTVYFPPIHPIGEEFRKGKNNNPEAKKGEPGSPWAIGSKHGGHKSINPELGTMSDFESLLKNAKHLGIEIAMDFALQCAPDHPYVKEHPQWFKWRSDGTVQYAENPPKKYQDILPIYFETKDYKNLWQELLSIALFWAEKGIRIFRVDNPHTKPIQFWQWLIAQVQKRYPDFIFLSEAFTRPKIMHSLAKVGFTQSYSYFTWRNSKFELIEYITEICTGPGKEYFRPNFWPNTPDINPFGLQDGNEHAFLTRYFLAATLSSNCGIYGPVFEQMIHDAIPGKEEYLNSEKYEIGHWDWNHSNKLIAMIKLINSIRKYNRALQQTLDIQFCEVNNDQLIAYHKRSKDGRNHILCVVNLDSYQTQSGMLQLPLERLHAKPGENIVVEDLITNNSYNWHEEWNYIELRPVLPFHLFKLQLRK